MKRWCLFFFGLILVLPFQAGAFRDINERSAVYPALEFLVESGVVPQGSFFRPESELPAGYFWEILLRDAEFDPQSATFRTPLPENIRDTDPLAPFLREAIRRDFVDGDQPFLSEKPIKRIEAIKWIVETKGILEPKYVSKSFRDRVSGVPPTAQYLHSVEAAHASQILNDQDLDPLRPYENITRAEFVQWLYQWHENGKQKESSLEPPMADRYPQYPYQNRVPESERSSERSNQSNIPTIRVSPQGGSNTDESLDMQVFRSVQNQIEKKYRFGDELTEEKESQMLNQAIEALVKGLEDKYSSYIRPDKAEAFKEQLDGKFEGIGAYVEMVDHRFTITAPIVGSPAEAAGVKAGDVVTHVDDQDISGQTINEIINQVRGHAGTTVKLTILRQGQAQEVVVTRGEITIPPTTLKWQYGIPIIGLHQFSRETAPELKTLLEEEVLTKNPRGLVFDLRNNPGGFLNTAVNVGALFLPEGAEVFRVDYGENIEVFETAENGLLYDYKGPIVFLQNRGSASASEILTSMIQDHELGTIVGQPSLGKGTVQEVLSFANGASLKLTVAKWITPKGRWIEGTGVIPDIEVADPTETDKKHDIDLQLQTALNIALGKR
jgi:C-terminal peptidase prc